MAPGKWLHPPESDPAIDSEGSNGRPAAFISRKTDTMAAFYLAAIFQFGWMGLARVGVLSFDRSPFPFLLFLSSLTQLLFMFVIMVSHHVIGKAADKRALQTYLDAQVGCIADQPKTHLS